MKITQLTLHNFRCVDHLTLDLDRDLTVIAGLDNGDGKTTILEGVALAATALFGSHGVLVNPGFVSDTALNSPWEDNLPAGQTGAIEASVQLESSWGRASRTHPEKPIKRTAPDGLKERVRAAFEAGTPLPLVVYYSTERGTIRWTRKGTRQPIVPESKYSPEQRERLAAFVDTLAARSSLAPTIKWFLDREALELRKDREARDQSQDGSYIDPVLQGVREAVQRAIPQCRRIRGASTSPPQVVVDWTQPDGRSAALGLRQLSGGTRAQLALVLDLARRMCQANPRQGVDGKALVLIDEIDLHLHPKWQQTVVGQLRRAFPNVQFIMTTHSDQVLSSVRPESILLLDRRSGTLTVRHPEYSYGRRSEDILEDEMGTPARAALGDELAAYASLVAQGEGRSDKAVEQRQRLETSLPANDEALRRADNELRRQAFLASMKAQ